MTMRRALSDPALLGGVLAGPTWAAWRVLLIAMVGEALTPEERVIFKQLTGRDHEPGVFVEEFLGIVGRRGGKSRAMAALVVFLACFKSYADVLSSGERATVLCLAANGKQAAIVLGYVVGIIESTPLLAGLVKGRTADSLELKSGLVIEVRAASFRGVRGVTCVAVICDETCFWFDEASGSANPDSAILDALRPSLATTGGPLIAISSPHARRGEAFTTWQRHYGEKGDKRILVAQAPSRTMNPSLPQSVVDRAMERDPAAASAEYLAMWRSDLEAFISLEAVNACADPGVFERAPISDIAYVAFVDPSGGSADSMTMAITHNEGDTVFVDAIREVKPPFSPEAVVAQFVEVLRSYRVGSIKGDRYAGEWPREQFRKLGVEYFCSDKTKSEIYGSLLPIVNSGKVALLDDKRLIAQLVALERRTARGGKDSIDHPPGQHDDRVNAVAGAILMAARQAVQPKVFAPAVIVTRADATGDRFATFGGSSRWQDTSNTGRRY
jgi:hypothetical protein